MLGSPVITTLSHVSCEYRGATAVVLHYFRHWHSSLSVIQLRKQHTACYTLLVHVAHVTHQVDRFEMAFQPGSTRRAGCHLLQRWALGSNTAATTAATTTTTTAAAAAAAAAAASLPGTSSPAASPATNNSGRGLRLHPAGGLVRPVSGTGTSSSRHGPRQQGLGDVYSLANRRLSSAESGCASSAADLVEMMRRIVHRGGRGRKQDSVPQEVGIVTIVSLSVPRMCGEGGGGVLICCLRYSFDH